MVIAKCCYDARFHQLGDTMEAKIKQRLVGSAVIVGLAVIFVPMLFEHSQQTVSSQINIPTAAEQTAAPLAHNSIVALPAVEAKGPAPHQASIARPQVAAAPKTAITTKPKVMVSVEQAPTEPNIATPVPKTAAAPSVSKPEIWVVQLASFGQAINAKKLTDKLKQLGFAGYSRQRTKANGQTLTQVLVGPQTDRAQAMQRRTRLKQQIHLQGIVIKVQS